MYRPINTINEIIAYDKEFIPLANVTTLLAKLEKTSSAMPILSSVMTEIFAILLPAKIPSFTLLRLLLVTDNASRCSSPWLFSCICVVNLEAVGAPIILASTAEGSSIKLLWYKLCFVVYNLWLFNFVLES